MSVAAVPGTRLMLRPAAAVILLRSEGWLRLGILKTVGVLAGNAHGIAVERETSVAATIGGSRHG